MKKTGRTEQIKFRATPRLKAAIKRAADRNGRSLSEEILFRLEYSLREEALLA